MLLLAQTYRIECGVCLEEEEEEPEQADEGRRPLHLPNAFAGGWGVRWCSGLQSRSWRLRLDPIGKVLEEVK
jgi:hypothetical protein